jgi:hypothetical protein
MSQPDEWSLEAMRQFAEQLQVGEPLTAEEARQWAEMLKVVIWRQQQLCEHLQRVGVSIRLAQTERREYLDQLFAPAQRQN